MPDNSNPTEINSINAIDPRSAENKKQVNPGLHRPSRGLIVLILILPKVTQVKSEINSIN